MVSKALALLIAAAFFNSTVVTASTSEKLHLFWSGKKNLSCTKLVEFFLSELRSFAEDTPIEMEEGTLISGKEKNELRCISAQVLELKTKPKENQPSVSFLFHYLEKAKTFSAEDWLQFQQKFLSSISEAPAGTTPPTPGPTPTPDLKPVPLTATEFEQKFQSFSPDAQKLQAEAAPSRWYENRWLWLGISAAVGTGVFLYIHQNSNSHLKINLAK